MKQLTPLQAATIALVFGMILSCFIGSCRGHVVEPCLLSDHVATIERNWVYDKCGGKVYIDQYIFWQYDDYSASYCIVDWRWAKGAVPSRVGRRWSLIFRDGEAIRRVTSDHYHETSGNIDREVLYREVLPIDQRRGLYRNP